MADLPAGQQTAAIHYRKNRTNEVVKSEKHEIKKQQAKRKDEDEMSVAGCIKEMEEIAALRRLAKNL